MFEIGNNYGTGRPPGSRNKAPNRRQVVELLNSILSDLVINYEELTKEDKIQLLKTFRHLFNNNETSSLLPDNEITIKIIQPNEAILPT